LNTNIIFRLRTEWFGNIRGDVLAGLVVALALIPEAIAFSIIAGVDPKVGLYASFSIAVIVAITGGRPGMISAATAATAVLMVTLVKDYGLQYLLAATVLAGLLQIAAGFLRVGYLMRFISKSVMTGFVNALAILIFMAQLPELINVPWLTYVMLAGGLAIIYLLPLITKMVPSPLICIIALTAISVFMGLDIRTVGDMGELPSTLPVFLIPDIPLNLETFLIILPYSAAVAAVGLLESLMTATIVDELTDTPSDKNRECIGQGIANTATGFIGGMAGCAMIGQSMINVKSGGRGRLSTLCAGIFLLLMIVFLGDWVKQIPMAALVIVVVATHNLATGVFVGVLFSGIFFAWKISQIFLVTSSVTEDGAARTYIIEGQLFFASAEKFTAAFDFKEALDKVIIDVSHAHIWDISSVAALDMVVLKFRREGAETEIIGLNEASETILGKLATHDEPGALDRLLGH